jgi:hypothetical protein
MKLSTRIKLLTLWQKVKNCFLVHSENVCYHLKRLDPDVPYVTTAYMYGEGELARLNLIKFIGNRRVKWVEPDGVVTAAFPEQRRFPRGTLILRRYEGGEVVYYVEKISYIKRWNQLIELEDIEQDDPKRVNFTKINP